MSTVTATYISQVTVVETFTGDFVGSDNTVTVDGLNNTTVLTASTTVPVTKQAAFAKALSSGTGTIDLTALPGMTADETVNGTGLKVQVCKLANPAANANAITVAKGASSGYAMIGSSFTITLQPGQEHTFYLNDAAPDIGSGAKNLDLTGTGTQALDVLFVMG
jgi:hypothetical protein